VEVGVTTEWRKMCWWRSRSLIVFDIIQDLRLVMGDVAARVRVEVGRQSRTWVRCGEIFPDIFDSKYIYL
jgi:hypothetical protein